MLGAADELVVIAAGGAAQDGGGDLVAPEALGNQPVLVHFHEHAAGRVDDRDAFGLQRGLLQRALDIQVDHGMFSSVWPEPAWQL